VHDSVPATRKTTEGGTHPDRHAQCTYSTERTTTCQTHGHPVIAVDAKTHELGGDCKHGGRAWQPRGAPAQVRGHDLPDQELGKAIPYGVYEGTPNAGWVRVGTDHDTAASAVETVRRWGRQMGRSTDPHATELLRMADGGGSNGVRTRLGKTALQRWADETGLHLAVRHVPPGTRTWKRIAQRMCASRTQHWRGRPPVSHEVIVNLMGHTTPQTELHMRAALAPTPSPTGTKVPDDALAALPIARDAFPGAWNYPIMPRDSTQ
jgi:hypothetical protein